MPYRPRLRRLGCLAPLLLCACGDGASTAVPIDLGPPRTLVYVGTNHAAAKHGGSHGEGAGIVHVYELGAGFGFVGEFAVDGDVSEVVATPDGSHVWIVSSSTGLVTFVDTTTYERTEVRVGVSPTHSFITPAHDEVWVGNDGSADVSVISLASLARTHTVLTGAGHHKVAFASTPAGGMLRAYVSNIIDGTVTPVGPDYAGSTNVTGVGPAPHGIDFSTTSRHVYNCSGDASNSIEVIAIEDDASTPSLDETNTVVERIALPARCSYLHVDDTNGYVFATVPSADVFVRVSLADHALSTFPTGDGPDQFVIVGGRAYVALGREANVTVLDVDGVDPAVTVAVGNAIAPGTSPASASRTIRAFAPYVFVPNAYDGTVTVIDTTDDSVAGTLTGMVAPESVAIAGPGQGTTYPR